MGYSVKLTTNKPVVTEEMVHEFRNSVPEHKRCPCYARNPTDHAALSCPVPTDTIMVAGSYSASGHKVRPFVEHMIRWFRKTKDIRLSADWRGC